MTPEIILICLILLIMVALFVTEALRVDVIAIIIMLTLGWLGLITPAETFSGFASNAVISIISVMILGYGIDRTGIMIKFSRKIVSIGGDDERRITGIISGCVGFLSAFIQNIGSAALFLPAILRISKKTKIPKKRLLLPMGYSAIIGGTLTMIGSSPLILLNDLLAQGDLEPFNFFSVTPIGVCLLLTAVIYFAFFGKYVLPKNDSESDAQSAKENFLDIWNLPKQKHHFFIPEKSPISGLKRENLNLGEYSLVLIALKEGKNITYAPWRHTVFAPGQILTILGTFENAETFREDYGLETALTAPYLDELTGEENAGFSEIILKPRSKLIGKTIREIAFRHTYGLEIIVFSGREGDYRHEFSDIKLNAGDSFVVYGSWKSIIKAGNSGEFLLLHNPEEKELKKSKSLIAVACFAGGIALSFAGVSLSLSLLTGAVLMILFGVLDIDEAYGAVDWRTVFLIAGLIPFGIAMENTGTAALIAQTITAFAAGENPLLILIAVAVLATFFSLFMSNVAATVILVPLVILIGIDTGIDPRGLALLTAVCASNSFILPTHQVNAFLMGQGGYHNSDFIKAGSIMTVLFISISVGLIYILFV
ncbi:MAG: SLC13 family permease [Methanomicrobium sp.]|nr:SLC13 family permease [Methanomicrobium sp.]MDD4299762.1 SLC13 family permease [Methanomicrobium sp.]